MDNWKHYTIAINIWAGDEGEDNDAAFLAVLLAVLGVVLVVALTALILALRSRAASINARKNGQTNATSYETSEYHSITYSKYTSSKNLFWNPFELT